MEVVGQKRLADKVTNILDRIEMELDEADKNIGEAMHLVDLDNDGLVSSAIFFKKFLTWHAEGKALLQHIVVAIHTQMHVIAEEF